LTSPAGRTSWKFVFEEGHRNDLHSGFFRTSAFREPFYKHRGVPIPFGTPGKNQYFFRHRNFPGNYL